MLNLIFSPEICMGGGAFTCVVILDDIFKLILWFKIIKNLLEGGRGVSGCIFILTEWYITRYSYDISQE